MREICIQPVYMAKVRKGSKRVRPLNRDASGKCRSIKPLEAFCFSSFYSFLKYREMKFRKSSRI